MACTEAFISYVSEMATQVGVVRSRKMFGDWMIYIDEKPAILACNNLAYIKMLPEIASLMAGAETGCPYPGAKLHYILDTDHRPEAVKVLKVLVPLLPYPKKRK